MARIRDGSSACFRITVVLILVWAGRPVWAQIQSPSGPEPSWRPIDLPEVFSGSRDSPSPTSHDRTGDSDSSHASAGRAGVAIGGPAFLGPAQEPAPSTRKKVIRYPFFTFGIRGGVQALSDEDADDVFGALPLVGADVKFHFWKLPLAAQGAFDYAWADGDADELSDPNFQDVEGKVALMAYRITAVAEPPPGFLGSSGGVFYLTPYIGVGVGLHVLDIDVDANTSVGAVSESVTKNAEGYHAIAGIDFVFGTVFSFGLEVMWSTFRIEDPLLEEDVDLGGLLAAFTIRVHI